MYLLDDPIKQTDLNFESWILYHEPSKGLQDLWNENSMTSFHNITDPTSSSLVGMEVRPVILPCT